MIKRYFYYYRDDKNRPVVTVCAMISFEENETRLLARGLAFCHSMDNPNKEEGRNLARKRATLAYDSGIDYFSISVREDLDHILEVIPYNDLHIFEYKSCADPSPTEFERRLMEQRRTYFSKKNDIIVLNEDDGEID